MNKTKTITISEDDFMKIAAYSCLELGGEEVKNGLFKNSESTFKMLVYSMIIGKFCANLFDDSTREKILDIFENKNPKQSGGEVPSIMDILLGAIL